jgi:hypothetical protein
MRRSTLINTAVLQYYLEWAFSKAGPFPRRGLATHQQTLEDHVGAVFCWVSVSEWFMSYEPRTT